MSIVIKIEEVVKKFGEQVAVDHVSLQVEDGEFLALLGPSGCGKTTLLRILGGFEKLDSGKVWMDGQDITDMAPNKRHLNMLFQSYALFPHMTVYKNVGYGLLFEKISDKEIDQRVREALNLVHMSEFMDRLPDHLSGGQRQRVALARALVKRPRVLLLDEPLSALDAKLRETMQSELTSLQRNVGITFIVVTHDQDEALSMASRIAIMREGKFEQIAPPRDLYEFPHNRFVADFVGRMNIESCCVLEIANQGVCVTKAGWGNLVSSHKAATLAVGDKTHFGIRPEKLSFTLQKPNNELTALPAVLENCSYHGNETLLYCSIADSHNQFACSLVNDQRYKSIPEVGAHGWLSWSAKDVIIFSD